MSGTFLAGELSFSSLSRDRPLREQVSEQLRAAVISGILRPGILYSAPILAKAIGTSATPVREAMQSLAREGLVDVFHNKGFRVKEISEVELDALVEARLLLEVPIMGAIAKSVNSRTQGTLKRLRQVASRLEETATNDDMVGYMTADTEFHLTFLSLHGNEVVVETVRNLRNKSRLYGLEQLARSGHLIEHTREHAQMIELALAGEKERLENLVRHHIGHIRTDWAEDHPL